MRLKIISLNIWNVGLLRQKAIDFLRREAADIVLLQEVYRGTGDVPDKYLTLQRLEEELDYPNIDYAQSFIEHTKYGPIPQGNAILSKLPISDSQLYFMADPVSPDFEYRDQPDHWPILPAPLQHVEVQTQAGILNVFNMHGVWDLEGDLYTDRRQKMVKVILQAVKDKKNVILAGDTNAKTTNLGIREIEKHLKTVFDQELKTTFNMRRKTNPGYATAAVDLMFVSDNIKIIDKLVPNVDVSDHLPLVVTLEIN